MYSLNDWDGYKLNERAHATCLFKPVSAGTHTIRWLALKAYWPFADPDKVLTVLDNSLTIVCSHFQLVLQPK